MRPLPVRRLTAVLIGAALLAAAHLPPRHAHPSSPGRGTVVHRHASLHVAGDPRRPRLCDSDGAIVWVDESYLSERAASPGPIDAALPEPLLNLPLLAARGRAADRAVSNVHGPPAGRAGPRAPPTCLPV